MVPIRVEGHIFLGSQKVSVSGVSSRGSGKNTLEGAKSLSEITPGISGKIPHCLKPFITLPGVNACGQARERRLLKSSDFILHPG